MYDRDGDGWGDTWYAGGNPPVELDRPYRDRGVPPRFKAYDRAILRWLLRTGKAPDMVADDDLEAFGSGDELRALYDLVVFPGHSEYMTGHAYDVVERFRDLGGRLIFLSANNFFWRVDKQGTKMTRVRLWRTEGRPEARLIGAQYRANDDGRRQGPYTVVAAEAAPWLFDKTGLDDRVDVRRDGGRLRDRDRLGDARLPAGNGGARPGHRSLRAGPERRDDVLRDARRRPRLRCRHARLRGLGHLLADDADAREPVAAHAAGPARTGTAPPRRRRPRRRSDPT